MKVNGERFRKDALLAGFDVVTFKGGFRFVWR